MSIVTEVHDEYWEKRVKTAREEHRIEVSHDFANWRLPARRTPTLIKDVFYAALAPVVVLWTLLIASVLYAVELNRAVYRSIGVLMRKLSERRKVGPRRAREPRKRRNESRQEDASLTSSWTFNYLTTTLPCIVG